MSVNVPQFSRRKVKSVQTWPEFNRWAHEQDAMSDQVVLTLQELARNVNNLTNQATIGGPSPLPVHAYTHLPLGSDALTTVAPAFSFGTAASVGTSNAFVRSNATIALFDATAAADIAAAAASGSAAFAARQDHVHRFPTTLMEYVNSKTLALSSTATVMTLTPNVATVELSSATTTAFRPSTTNAIALGATTLRWLSLFVGTNGINNTGKYTPSGASATVGGNWIPDGNNTRSLGSSSAFWVNLYCTSYHFPEQAFGAFDVQINFVSSAAYTSGRTLQIDTGDADRNITFTGSPTLADWFDQSVKQAASPTFAGLTITDNNNIVLGTTNGTKIGTGTTQKIGLWNTAPTAQYNTTGTATGFTAGAGTAVDHLATFTGNTGSTAYTIGDIVRALKLFGVMAA